MAQRHPSVLKRARQNVKRNKRNTIIRSSLRTTVKKVVTAIEARDAERAHTELPQAVRALDKAASKGVIHRNQAARKISRLTCRVQALTATDTA
jgi:small subunit ribosomal protein S20